MKRGLTILGILAAGVLLMAIVLPLFIDANRFRPLLESELTKDLCRPVKVGNLKLALFSGGVTASDVAIADDPNFSRDSFLTAKALVIHVDLGPLIFSRQLIVKGINIEQPSIALLQAPTGQWNFSSLGARSVAAANAPASATPAGSGLDLSVNSLKITDGRVVLGKIGRKVTPEVFDKVNVEIKDFSATSVFPLSLTASATGGAEINLQGKAGPLHSARASSTPVDAQLTVTHLDLARSGFLPATGFAGLVSINGTLVSTGQNVEVKGNVKADQLVLAKGGSPAKKPVAFDFALEHDLDKHAGALRRGQIHIGAAAASLTGTYRTESDTTVLNMKLSGPNMPIPELEAILPALDIVLPAGSSLQGGTAVANFTVSGPVERLVVDGSASLTNTRLAGFDLGAKMAVVTQLAGIRNGPNTDIQSFSATVHIDANGTRTDNISLIAPEIGELNGAGTVSAAHALDFKMTAKVRTGGVLAAMGPNTNIPFRIVGTSSDPKFQPDIKAIATDKIKSFAGSDAGKAAIGGILKGLFGGKKK